MTKEGYLPALRFEWLTGLYDPVIRWTMREGRFKTQLVAQARIERGHRVLDLGCGTGTLTILIKRMHPDADVVGLDGDPKILELARSKATLAGLDIVLDCGMADALPYPDKTFDRVVSSLVVHHLTRNTKLRALCEVMRVLKPGGELHVADFGTPHNAAMYGVSLVIRHFEEVADNVKGLLPAMLRETGFDRIEETVRYSTVFGTLALLKASKPDVSA